MSLTRLSLNLFTTSFILIGLGMALGSLPLIYAGFTPLIFLGLSLTLVGVETVEIEPIRENLEVCRGEIIELTRNITCRGGVGYILLYEEVPDSFELVEGENLQLHVKNSKDLRIRFSYKLRCIRRGVYDFNQISYNTRHAVEATTSRKGVLKLSQRIVVKPPRTSVKSIRAREPRTTLPIPSDSKMQLGIVSHDFKELKKYIGGDPYKHINWKATARNIHTSTDLPIVNDYEREGNKAVWLFLDASSQMELGNNVINNFEYAVQLALGLAEYYLSRRCVVGFSLYNDDEMTQPIYSKPSHESNAEQTDDTRFNGGIPAQGTPPSIKSGSSHKFFSLPPEAGNEQLHRIERLLWGTEVNMARLSLMQTIKLNKTHFEYANPMTYIITSVRKNRVKHLQDELIDLERINTKKSNGRKHIFLINVKGYSLSSKTVAQRIAAQIMDYEEENLLKRAITNNVTLINLDPSKTDPSTTLLMEATKL
jgi:uncharacterized protein (DUF58 family)